ncbi:MAG TPA: hypothetical protein VGN52_11075 [Burkholderiales bacterium]
MAMPWYTAEDYGEVRELMADRQNMPRTFEAWERAALQVEEETVRLGASVVRAVIEPWPFKAWCKMTGMELNAWARTTYAQMLMRSQRGGQG